MHLRVKDQKIVSLNFFMTVHQIIVCLLVKKIPQIVMFQSDPPPFE